MELIDHAVNVFDVGFVSARGDTSAALSSAVAGVLSSVFVINLNLKSFKGSYWARQQRRHCDELQRRITEKQGSALTRVMQLRTEDLEGFKANDPTELISKLSSKAQDHYSRRDIDERVAELHQLVWRKRGDAGADTDTRSTPFELLNPEVALNFLGYSFETAETLGQFQSDSGTFEVAGLLEAQIGKVSISGQMEPNVRFFTAAHELGHVILHPKLKDAHRDRPLDGVTRSRLPIEREADEFASSYLMPPNLVSREFAARFGSEIFTLSDDTAFALFGTGLAEAQKKTLNLRGLSRILASAERFNGRQVVPLAIQFKVSFEAMAIRLEELGLVFF